MSSYAHRPQPSGLHAKMLRELSETGHYVVGACHNGKPNHVVVRMDRRCVRTSEAALRVLWAGHRDLMPSCYRGARDPHGLLSRPSSD